MSAHRASPVVVVKLILSCRSFSYVRKMKLNQKCMENGATSVSYRRMKMKNAWNWDEMSTIIHNKYHFSDDDDDRGEFFSISFQQEWQSFRVLSHFIDIFNFMSAQRVFVYAL